MSDRVTHPAVTCLGCGCACDDITVIVDQGRILDARGACVLGAAWFGRAPAAREPTPPAAPRTAVDIDDTLVGIAARLRTARRPLVLLAPDLTTEAQREAVGLADEAHALIDSGASPGVRALTLATQERGRVSATFAEIRRRADLIVWWGCDPDESHPRFRERCVAGTPASGRERVTIAVDIGEWMGPVDAGLRIAITETQATSFVTAVRATLQGAGVQDARGPREGQARRDEAAAVLAGHLVEASYALIVIDADAPATANLGATSALLALVSTLNEQTRAALLPMRSGGNGNGADAVLTWQAGAPLAIDFATGVSEYCPVDGARERLARGDVDLALVIGRAASLDPDLLAGIAGVSHVLIGPEATASARGHVACVAAIETGVAGIHEAGTAVRMDEVPLPLRAPLGPTSPGADHASPSVTTADLVRALRVRCRGARA